MRKDKWSQDWTFTAIAPILNSQINSRGRILGSSFKILYQDLFQDGRRKGSQQFLKPIALAVVQHSLSNYGISSKGATLLGIFKTAEKSSAKRDGLFLVRGGEGWAQFLENSQ
jgi:hypothetical protein